MNPPAGSLDTNILLRLLLKDVASQHRAAIKLFASSAGQFAVADTAFIEMAFVLDRHYRFTRQEIVEAIEGLMILPKLDCNRALLGRILPLYAKNSSLSLKDCSLTVYAELNHATPLWTFDKKLAAKLPHARLVPTD